MKPQSFIGLRQKVWDAENILSRAKVELAEAEADEELKLQTRVNSLKLRGVRIVIGGTESGELTCAVLSREGGGLMCLDFSPPLKKVPKRMSLMFSQYEVFRLHKELGLLFKDV